MRYRGINANHITQLEHLSLDVYRSTSDVPLSHYPWPSSVGFWLLMPLLS